MEDLKFQAQRFGTDIRYDIINKVDLSKRPFLLVTDSEKEILADSIIIATGASAKWLGLESEEKFRIPVCSGKILELEVWVLVLVLLVMVSFIEIKL